LGLGVDYGIGIVASLPSLGLGADGGT